MGCAVPYDHGPRVCVPGITRAAGSRILDYILFLDCQSTTESVLYKGSEQPPSIWSYSSVPYSGQFDIPFIACYALPLAAFLPCGYMPLAACLD